MFVLRQKLFSKSPKYVTILLLSQFLFLTLVSSSHLLSFEKDRSFSTESLDRKQTLERLQSLANKQNPARTKLIQELKTPIFLKSSSTAITIEDSHGKWKPTATVKIQTSIMNSTKDKVASIAHVKTSILSISLRTLSDDAISSNGTLVVPVRSTKNPKTSMKRIVSSKPSSKKLFSSHKDNAKNSTRQLLSSKLIPSKSMAFFSNATKLIPSSRHISYCPTVTIFTSYCPSIRTSVKTMGLNSTAVSFITSLSSNLKSNEKSASHHHSLHHKSSHSTFETSSIVSSQHTSQKHYIKSSSSIIATSSKAVTGTVIHSTTASTPSLVTTSIPAIPIVDECQVIAIEFSSALSNFTACILGHLNPMTVCRDCFSKYKTLLMQHGKINDCDKQLIRKFNAKYQVVAAMYESQISIWHSLDCEKCYDKESDPENQEMTPGFKDFFVLYNEIKTCFRNYSRQNANKTSSNQTLIDSVCTKCKPLYKHLQNTYPFYVDKDEEKGILWCADVNVAVNQTRHDWSFTYQCNKKERDLQAIIAMTCIFCFLPIAFYIGAKLHSDVRERSLGNRYYESD